MSYFDMPFIDHLPGDAPRPPGDGHTPETCDKVLGLQAQVEAVKAQLEDAHKKIDVLEAKIDSNNKALEENTSKTNEIFEIIQMGKGFFRTVGWIGGVCFRAVGWIGKWLRRIVMWVVPPVVAIIGLWHSINNKTP